jgi:hypothetical protein
VASGLLLSLAVGWRSFPILLLPFFLTSLDQTAKKIRFTACVVAPVALSMIPFLWLEARPMLHEVLSYSGWGIHHGPFAVVRGLHLLSLGRVTWENPPEWTPWMSASKLVFLGLYGLAVFFSKRMGLLNGILVTLFLFDLVYSGVASQYLIWTVPFLLLTPRRVMFWCYELAATYALVVFYWLFFPDILFGALDSPRMDVVTLLRHYVISQVLFSASVCRRHRRLRDRDRGDAAPRSTYGGGRAGGDGRRDWASLASSCVCTMWCYLCGRSHLSAL